MNVALKLWEMDMNFQQFINLIYSSGTQSISVSRPTGFTGDRDASGNQIKQKMITFEFDNGSKYTFTLVNGQWVKI